ncbi:protein of unknown function [Streptomyces sp. KY75]|nr:protein of unknown function [Streptomyces sp. KY75]CAD5974064.1 protein of unknown function [Streptomyces sp. KY70]
MAALKGTYGARLRGRQSPTRARRLELPFQKLRTLARRPSRGQVGIVSDQVRVDRRGLAVSEPIARPPGRSAGRHGTMRM